MPGDQLRRFLNLESYSINLDFIIRVQWDLELEDGYKYASLLMQPGGQKDEILIPRISPDYDRLRARIRGS